MLAALASGLALAPAGLNAPRGVVIDGASSFSSNLAKSLNKAAAAAADVQAVYRTGSPYTRRSGYPNGPGWTQAQVQRMARKKRNQARHRKAARGGK